MKCILNKKRIEKIIPAKETKVGDLMQIVEPGLSYNGHVLLHTFTGFVSLNNPIYTWSSVSSLKVILLDKGDSVILEQE